MLFSSGKDGNYFRIVISRDVLVSTVNKCHWCRTSRFSSQLYTRLRTEIVLFAGMWVSNRSPGGFFSFFFFFGLYDDKTFIVLIFNMLIRLAYLTRLNGSNRVTFIHTRIRKRFVFFIQSGNIWVSLRLANYEHTTFATE